MSENPQLQSGSGSSSEGKTIGSIRPDLTDELIRAKSQKDIDRLTKEIEEITGVDLAKYRQQKVADKLVDLLLLPRYIVAWGIRPPLFAFVLYFAGFWVIPMEWLGIVLYILIGSVLFVVNGALTGVIFLLYRIYSDLASILGYAFDVLGDIVKDLHKMGIKLRKKDAGPILTVLFRGILFLVAIPVLSDALTRKIPLVGSIMKWLVRRMMVGAAVRIKWPDPEEESDESQKPLDQDLDKPTPEWIVTYVSIIDKARRGIDSVLKGLTWVASMPFLLIYSFTMFLLVIFLWLLW